MQKQRRRIKKRNKRKHQKIARLCGLFFVCFLLIYSIIYFVLYRKVNKVPENRVSEGIYIGEVNVSGLTAEQAQKAVDQKLEEYKKQNFTFQVEGQSASASFGELGFDIKKEEKLIKQAVEYGKEGNIWSRYFKLRKLKKENKVFKPTYDIDAETGMEVMKERIGGFLQGASNAEISRQNGTFVIKDEQEGLEVNEQETLKKIRTFLNKKWKGKDGSIEVVSQKQKPTITRADLEVIQDRLGTFSTYCGSGQTRVTNIINGAKHINGTVVMPGEEFSAGKTMSPFSLENGYVEAGAFENGEVVQSLAGGICQVSTTLYNAVINAELEVTSRQPHSMTVAYVKPSRDAAIAGDYKDFRFKNSTETPILIEGYVSGGNVVFNIYGKETRPAGRKLEFISETVSSEEPKKEFEEQADAAVGTVKERTSAHRKIAAQLWKVVYENGKEVSRKVINKSTYKSSPTKVLVGTASANPEYTKIIRNAIKTQDEAKINEAIAEVKAKEQAAAQTPQTSTEQTPQQEGQ